MEVFLVDAFSSGPFTGNPTMVCLLPFNSVLCDDFLQKLANEMNLSETAFVTMISDNDDFKFSSQFSLRWFSPTCEVNICGHGTLATAAILWKIFGNINQELIFDTMSGKLKAVRSTSVEDDLLVTIDLPASPSETARRDDFSELIELIVGNCEISTCHYCSASSRLLIGLPDGTTRKQLESLPIPNYAALLALQQSKVRGIIVTVKSSDEDYDFYSRYFAPWWGNDEDHVTGAAHTTLVPYWSTVLQKLDMRARQCSPRGGDLSVEMNWNKARVLLTGRAEIFMKGTILIDH